MTEVRSPGLVQAVRPFETTRDLAPLMPGYEDLTGEQKATMYEALERSILIRSVEAGTLDEKIEAMSGAIDRIHSLQEYYIRSTGIREFSQTGDYSELDFQTRKTASMLRKNLDSLQYRLQTDKARDILSERRAKLFLADQQFDEGASQVEVVAARREQFPKRLVVTDMDNTITDHSKLKKVNGIDPLLLGSAIADPLIGKDREYFPEVYAAIWRKLQMEWPEIFFLGGQAAPLREGMESLFVTLSEQEDLQTIVMSTNFYPFVVGVMSGLRDDNVRPISVQPESVRATAKGDVLNLLAILFPDASIEYIGDGASDFPTLEAAGIVTAYHPLKGESFDKRLQQEEKLSFPFETGHDLIRNLGLVA